MFNSKKEKELERALQEAREENERKSAQLRQTEQQYAELKEQLEQMKTSREQMGQDMEQVREHMRHIAELSEHTETASGEVCNTITGLDEAVRTFDENHAGFVRDRKKQDDAVLKIVENNKHFTSPMKYILEFPGNLRETYGGLSERVVQMRTLSQNMSVLSLNCAIEAGRMGESGTKFVAAAEDVRAFSEQYEREAAALGEEIEAAGEKVAGLQEQIHHLNELLKENNISMTKLLSDAKQGMERYEASQLALRDFLPETAAGKADALRQAQKEAGRIEERMQIQMSDIIDEYAGQGEKLEAIRQIIGGLK